MKIGINMFLWTDFVDETYFKHFEELKNAGYDGVEIPLFAGDEKHYQKLGGVLKELGMQCSSTSACLPDRNLISGDAAIRQAGVDHLKWAVDMAAAMGADLLGGPIHSAPGVFTGNGPTESELKFAADGLREVGQYAEKSSISLAVEYLNRFESYLTNSVEQTKALVQQVNLANVGIHYDTHHAHYEEYDVKEALLAGKGYINHIQLSESNRGIPGQGQVHWQRTFEAISEIGYDGWLTIEAFNKNHEGLRKNLFLWRELYDHPAKVYNGGIELIKNQYQDLMVMA